MKDIDGKVVQLDQVAKKVTLVVNVACFCGLTRHYPGLQELQVGIPSHLTKGQGQGQKRDRYSAGEERARRRVLVGKWRRGVGDEGWHWAGGTE